MRYLFSLLIVNSPPVRPLEEEKERLEKRIQVGSYTTEFLCGGKGGVLQYATHSERNFRGIGGEKEIVAYLLAGRVWESRLEFE